MRVDVVRVRREDPMGEGDATRGGMATGHAAGGPCGALGSGRGVRRRVWGAGGGGRRDILGQDGVLEAIPILLGTAIGDATVRCGPPGVTGAAIGDATVRGVLPLCAVPLCILPVCHVILCVLVGLERVGMPRRRVRRHLWRHGVRQRGLERVERGSQAVDGGGLLSNGVGEGGHGALEGAVDERSQAHGDVSREGCGVRPRGRGRRVGDGGALRSERRGSGGRRRGQRFGGEVLGHNAYSVTQRGGGVH